MQTPKLIVKKVRRQYSTDDLVLHGDYYITKSLGSTDPNAKIHPAIIIRCPFCRMEMASTSQHEIILPKLLYLENFFIRLLKAIGFPHGVTVKGMLQCPYHPAHKFLIKNGRVKAL